MFKTKISIMLLETEKVMSGFILAKYIYSRKIIMKWLFKMVHNESIWSWNSKCKWLVLWILSCGPWKVKLNHFLETLPLFLRYVNKHTRNFAFLIKFMLLQVVCLHWFNHFFTLWGHLGLASICCEVPRWVEDNRPLDALF